ncbi:MAG: response regulator [Caldisericia bacterium]|nr:response regulator [Caldisericia bacterium]
MRNNKKVGSNCLFILFILVAIIGIWVVYAFYDYRTMQEQLKFLFFKEPLQFTDSLLFHISKFSVATRLFVISIFIVATVVIRRSFFRLHEKTEELKDSREKIKQSELRYRMLFNTNNDPILMLKEWETVDCNRKALSLFGYELKQDLLSQDFLELFPVEQENKIPTNTIIQNIRQKISNQNFDIAPFDFLFKTRTGKIMSCTITISPLIFSNSEYCQILIRDTTLQKLYEKELIESRDKADKANEAKSLFVSTMSHELRTPLNAIIGFSKLLEKESLKPRLANFVQSINKAGENLLTLINNILDLSRIEAHKVSIKKEPIQLFLLADEIESIFSCLAQKKNIDFTINTSKKDYCMAIDVQKVKQILTNLTGNAIKFTKPNGSVSVTLEINDIQLPDSNSNSFGQSCTSLFTATVSDNGIGIPLKDQCRIFNSFEQSISSSQDSDTVNGSGLGLSISKNLASLLDGDISVKSEENKGSIFTFTLQDTPILFFKTESNNYIDIEPSNIKKVPILSIDDTQSNLDVMTAMLYSLDLEVDSASNEEEALSLCHNKLYGFIFIDLKLNGNNGSDLAKTIRSIANYKEIPIIAVTATQNAEEEYDLKPFNDILLKPLTLDALSTTLSKHLNPDEISTNREEKKDLDDFTYSTEKSKTTTEISQITPEIYSRAYQVFHARISPYNDNFAMKEVEKLGNDFIDFGSLTRCEYFVNTGKQLLNAASYFDFNELKRVFRELNNLLKSSNH